MKYVHRLTFNRNRELEKLLASIYVLPKTKNNLFAMYYVFESSAKWETIKSLSQSYKVWDLRFITYTEQDFTQADWFTLAVSESAYPQPEEKLGYRFATYDTSGYCPTCGIGYKQNNPFRLLAKINLKTYQFFGLHWVHDAVFVKREIQSMFEQYDITGITYIYPVYHRSGKQMTDFRQLVVPTILPEGFIYEKENRITCKIENEEYVQFIANNQEDIKKYGLPKQPGPPYCQRIKYLLKLDQPVRFKKESFHNAPDFIQTAEWFGSAHSARRLIIVSKKVYRFVKANNWKGAVFTPVMLQ